MQPENERLCRSVKDLPPLCILLINIHLQPTPSYAEMPDKRPIPPASDLSHR